ncbi:bifunctional salicylyl-CoA 5-hydroxylase/oxidoreductase [Herbiconiux moechotypicola]|uniref:Bifunctional salicylyl-CoA 5-hydroxylase/oxidoreductase n=1 Tax=Herbiconiux moechotypicola TaxID=637393 RepID=A0ABN3DD93_9MICO|nr:bifunctional salicylyl-CoA 5-hydroxylase/oxidoreductase [Herbiconiux moechotypicola]MCS5728683.1 bifunctional salicylyl-CoA 5-hydroxylase/oxidoreductase [Herbiconiux moechotypicola]
MKVAVIGGGPGGLYFACLMKQLDPEHRITVWERNAADDTFGFGVVFSDETLQGIRGSDPVFLGEMERSMAQWNDIDIDYRGETHTVGGQGFAAMSRRDLLGLLQARAVELGVDVRFSTVAPDVEELSRDFDLAIAADGLNSAVRTRFADTFRPDLDVRKSKYIWLAVDEPYEAFRFIVKQTPYGVMQVHAYPYSDTESTFIVEMHPDVWERAGFAASAAQTPAVPGVSDEGSIALIHELFAEELGGARLLSNNSKWITFTTVRNASWRHGNIVLLGDAAHTAHFSIGSGTKLALEDALALAASIHENDTLDAALDSYDAERRPVVASIQRAAQASLEWFENIGVYADQEPEQFCFNLLTRSRRITLENLKLRDPEFAARVTSHFGRGQADPSAPPMFQPVSIGGLELPNRVVLAPMDQYSAVEGLANDFHLVHLGSKALGGAGLVMTEMVCVSAEGRITLGCTGLYTDAQRDAYTRVVDFVHERSSARIGVQLGHSGRKGSTRLMWEGIDEPLDEGGWEPVGPSAVPYASGGRPPREISRAEMDEVREQFVAAARRAGEAGFDLLELHAAHGYLLSSFLSPVSNHRTDEYGGTLENRLRFPLEVFDAVRAAFPADRPVTVRLSAVDWVEGGNEIDDAVAIARAFVEHGADAIHVSSGQVAKEERPAYGRSYQAPFADRIRNEVAAAAGVPVITVGAISSFDDVNSLILAGRADLCALGRPHLYDPQWTLHAAADQEYRGPGAEWPLPFRAGRRKPPTGRTEAVRPRLELVRASAGDSSSDAAGAEHTRWRPATRVEPAR